MKGQDALRHLELGSIGVARFDLWNQLPAMDNDPLDLQLFVTIPFVLSFFLTAALGWSVARAILRRRWPSVPGKILHSSIRESFRIDGDMDDGMTKVLEYIPQLSYEYEVAGKRYVSNDIEGFSPPDTEDRVQVEAMLARWTPGTVVTVYYRPSRPRKAYLAPNAFPRVRLVLLVLSLVPLWWTAILFRAVTF